MTAQAASYPDLALHSLGWKAFQDLCADVCEVILKRPVEVFREAQDGGQDAIFFSKNSAGEQIATVQCKFTSKKDQKLQLGDLTEELKSVEDLVANGQANTYVLMTNRIIDAPDAIKIRRRLTELGVVRAHLFGRHYITRAIRNSARLRALVPRIYGLGDLSTILDDRSARQTEALLGHLKPLLQVYVTTAPHASAVRSLAKNSLVLLLGDPGTGKSTIAAILSTLAASNPDRMCFKADGVHDFISRWNPHETGFFWIDDAFGPNQLREDFVDSWLTHFPKMLAAIGRGSQFVLTSRHHIYKGAEIKLGSRNLSLFREGQAVVHTGTLSSNERLQLLYNHIKAGGQSWAWKSRIKGFLPILAQEVALIPEIARRLADPAYTKQLDLTLQALIQFVKAPKAHLLQTIREMSKEHRAALTLVFLHRGRMQHGGISAEMQHLITNSFGVDREALGIALSELRDSFLVQQPVDGVPTWSFKHPTVADAISTFLGETEGLVELYLRGTRPEVIIAEVVCSGGAFIPDAIVVPESLNSLLASIVGQIHDEPYMNNKLFAFLDARTSDAFFKAFVSAHADSLGRKAAFYREMAFDSRVNVLARAHRFGLLPEGVRADAATTLSVALSNLDASFLENDNILALVPPTELIRMLNGLRKALIAEVTEVVSSTVKDVDHDVEPEEHFYELREHLEKIELVLFGTTSDEDEPVIADINELIASGIEEIREAQEEKKREDEEDEWITREWESRQSRQPTAVRPSVAKGARGARSIFSDLDE